MDASNYNLCSFEPRQMTPLLPNNKGPTFVLDAYYGFLDYG